MNNTRVLIMIALAGWLIETDLVAQNAVNVTQLIRDSQAALSENKTADAETLAKRAVDMDAAHPPAWRQYGFALMRNGKAMEAATALQRSVALDEKDANAWRGLALVEWQTHHTNDAVRAQSTYLRLKPEDASGWRDLATWLTQLQHGDQAVSALERVVELKPDDLSAWRELGAWRIRLTRFEPGVAALERVVKAKPDEISAWRDLATGLVRLQRHEQAVAALERVVRSNPDDVSAWRDLASELTRLERTEPAVNALERVVTLAPDDAAAWRDLASGLTRQDRNEQAVAALGRVVALKPDDAAAWRALAVFLQRSGRLADAAQAFERALAIHPDDAVTQRDLGWVLWPLGRRPEAVAHLTKAIEDGLESGDRVVYQVVARLSEEGASSDALAFLKRVSPNKPPSVLGLALARAGRLRAAEPILLNAWQGGDHSADVGLHLAYARAVNGQFNDLPRYLAPLIASPAALSPERADLALEALRLGNTRPEAPGLVTQLEAVLPKTDRYDKRVTDILETAAEASRTREDPKQALRLYRRVLERDPDRACWIWAALTAETVDGKTPEAWLSALEQRTSNPARKAGIAGLRSARHGHTADAISALRQSVALDPAQPMLRQILFDCLLRQGRVAEARAEADWFAKRVEAGDGILRSYWAEMLMRLGDTEAALVQWQMLVQTNPDSTYYGIQTAEALYRLNRPDEAMTVLRTLAGTRPNHSVFELMAEIETARAHTAAAVEWAARGLKAAPSQGLLRYYAESLEKEGTNNAPQILATAQAFLKNDPGYVPMTLLAGRQLEATGATNEFRAFYQKQLARNPDFVPSLTALRDRETLDGQIDKATEFARRRTDVQPHNPEAWRAYANSLAQQDQFRKSLTILRPLARTPLEKAVPILVYQSVTRPPYAGRNSVDQIARHIKRLADDGVTFINAFSQLAEKPNARHVMLVLVDPEPEVIEALDPVLRQYNARVVYAGNAAFRTITLSGLPIPEKVGAILAGDRWQLASAGPADLARGTVNGTGVLGNPLTHRLMIDGARETPAAFSNRLDRTLAESSVALAGKPERILVYPAGDFGHRSLDTDRDSLTILHNAVAQHFSHAIYFDDCGFYVTGPSGDPLRIPARVVPPEWGEKELSVYLGTGHPLTRARLELARVLYWHGQHEKAHAAFARAQKAGADSRELLYNWGMNAERAGDLATAREKLLAAKALDPESERILNALARLDESTRPQATAFISGWSDNENRDHYRYGGYGDVYVSDRLRLGALADRDRWSTSGIGSESGTRAGLRALAFLWPEVWLEGQFWYLDMDSADDHWGGEARLRLPNPLFSGYVYLVAGREEIETVEALRAGIDANTYAAQTYSRLADMYDLFLNVAQTDRSDGNDTTMLDGRLLYRLHEWPYVGIGWRFRFADSDYNPPEYWAPERLQQHQAHISVRGAWKRLSYTLSAEAGYARERETDWRFVWGARGDVNYAITRRVGLRGELGYFESPDYNRTFGRLGVTGRF